MPRSLVERLRACWQHATLLGWALVWLTFSFLVAGVPLLRDPGFEQSLVAGLLAAWCSADIAAAHVSRWRHQARPAPELAHEGSGTRALAVVTIRAWLLATALASLPLVIAALRSPWRPWCDPAFAITCHLYFVVLGTLVWALIGTSIALVCRRRLVTLLATLGALLGAIFAAVWRFYHAPQVFSHNLAVGYFPGNLYDEDVTLAAGTWLSRLDDILLAFTLLLSTLLIIATVRRGRLVGVGVGLGLTFSALIGLRLGPGRSQYALGKADIERELSLKLTTEHFVIHYSPTNPDRLVMQQIADDHEFRYAQVTARLGIEVPSRIHSYYFDDTTQKARLLGARDVEMAKPWRREIYLDHRDFPLPSLRHEIAHVVAGEFGSPWFRVSARRLLGLPVLVNPGMVEGLAVAADWPGAGPRELTPDQSVRAMQILGMSPPLAQLFSLQFFSAASSRGYTTAGSFVHYLLERFGPTYIQALYRSGGDFASLGTPFKTLHAGWLAHLEMVPVSQASLDLVRQRFKRGSIFERACPHAQAKAKRRLFEMLADGDRAAATRLQRELCRRSPGDVSQTLDLAELLLDEALGHLRSSANAAAEASTAEAYGLLTQISDNPDENPGVRATAQLRRLEHDFRKRSRQQPIDTRALADATRSTLPLATENNQRRKLVALLELATRQDIPAEAQTALLTYYLGARYDDPPTPSLEITARARAAAPNFWLANYMHGLLAYGQGDAATAIGALGLALTLGLPDANFLQNASYVLALAAYQAEDETAFALGVQALAGGDAMSAALAQDLRERWQWRAAKAR